jgi:hypothetical protein
MAFVFGLTEHGAGGVLVRYDMDLITKNKVVMLCAGALLALSLDASAVPFFAKRDRNSLAQAQSEAGAQGAPMAGFTRDVQSGLNDFQFLARNFSGSSSGSGRAPISTTGLIGAVPTTTPGPVVPTPLPGSFALFALGGAGLMFWRRKK